MSIKVGVRVRPFNDREKKNNSVCIIEMNSQNQTKIKDEKGNEKTFTFDHSFWSHDGFRVLENGYFEPEGTEYADQKYVFNQVGKEILDNAWEGYHCCLFAYGQTGSGKSYSMVGYGANKGIVPISCDEIFTRIKNNKDKEKSYEVQVSMLEIYNEKIQDLLIPAKNRPQHGLKIRESKVLGIFVDGLSKHPVTSYEEISKKMDEGYVNRTIGSTLMNATSSRAHTIVIIEFKQCTMVAGKKSEKLSMINLVDLAGSERAGSTGATGERLKEGCNINKSLLVLGNVINALADKALGKGKNVLPPYRDSALTRILQNALGGNSKTVMICALSPASINYEETLSTLRYADRAKKIQNKAVVNESEHDKMVRLLKEENNDLKKMIEDLQKKLMGQGGIANVEDKETFKELKEQYEANQQQMKDMEKTFEQKLEDAKKNAVENIIVNEEQLIEKVKDDIKGLMTNIGKNIVEENEFKKYVEEKGIDNVSKEFIESNNEILKFFKEGFIGIETLKEDFQFIDKNVLEGIKFQLDEEKKNSRSLSERIDMLESENEEMTLENLTLKIDLDERKKIEKKYENSVCKNEEIIFEKNIKENLKEICKGNDLTIEALKKIVEYTIKKEIELKIIDEIKKKIFEIKKNENVNFEGKKKEISIEIQKQKEFEIKAIEAKIIENNEKLEKKEEKKIDEKQVEKIEEKIENQPEKKIIETLDKEINTEKEINKFNNLQISSKLNTQEFIGKQQQISAKSKSEKYEISNESQITQEKSIISNVSYDLTHRFLIFERKTEINFEIKSEPKKSNEKIISQPNETKINLSSFQNNKDSITIKTITIQTHYIYYKQNQEIHILGETENLSNWNINKLKEKNISKFQSFPNSQYKYKDFDIEDLANVQWKFISCSPNFYGKYEIDNWEGGNNRYININDLKECIKNNVNGLYKGYPYVYDEGNQKVFLFCFWQE